MSYRLVLVLVAYLCCEGGTLASTEGLPAARDGVHYVLMNARLSRALELHRAAAEELLRAAEAVPESRWRDPVQEGKWSPAEILEHLNNTYDILLSELSGGAGMKIRTALWQRILLRLTIVPRIMKKGIFPKNAPAPKEIRPLNAPDREPAISAFRERAERLEATAKTAAPKQKVTHAYFGSSSVANGVTLCARHIQHHTVHLLFRIL